MQKKNLVFSLMILVAMSAYASVTLLDGLVLEGTFDNPTSNDAETLLAPENNLTSNMVISANDINAKFAALNKKISDLSVVGGTVSSCENLSASEDITGSPVVDNLDSACLLNRTTFSPACVVSLAGNCVSDCGVNEFADGNFNCQELGDSVITSWTPAIPSQFSVTDPMTLEWSGGSVYNVNIESDQVIPAGRSVTLTYRKPTAYSSQDIIGIMLESDNSSALSLKAGFYRNSATELITSLNWGYTFHTVDDSVLINEVYRIVIDLTADTVRFFIGATEYGSSGISASSIGFGTQGTKVIMNLGGSGRLEDITFQEGAIYP